MLASNVYANWLNKLVLLTPLEHSVATHKKLYLMKNSCISRGH